MPAGLPAGPLGLAEGVALPGPGWPVLGVGAVVVVLLAVLGARVRDRAGATAWRRSWWLVAAGTGLVAACEAVSPASVVDRAEPGTVVATLVVAAGLVGVLRDRTTRGRAVDTTLEVLLAVGALGFALGALATSTGASPVSWSTVAPLAQPLATVVVLWLLARVIEVTPDASRPLHLAALGSGLLLAAQLWRALLLLRDGAGVPPSGTTLLLAGGLVLWAVALVDGELRHPGPTMPVSGFDLQATNLMTLVTPLMVGPLTAVTDLAAGGDARPWVVVTGAFAVPLAVVTLLVRQVRLRARREYLAQHDPLTGLPNQRLFLDEVEIELARTRRTGTGFAVMFLDLDRFKTVNDSLGHDVGDDLLRAVADRLLATRGEADVVARVGGDEFTVLVPGLVDAARARDRAVALQAAFAEPLPVGARQLFTGASVGVAIAPRDGTHAAELLKHADTAMYRAKASGPGRVQQYSSELQGRARLRLLLEQELRRAIEDGALTLWYQPKVRADDHALVGREALVRWNHPALGLVSPAAFVPLAEETGLIGALGRFVLDAACAQVATWATEVDWPRPVAVNVSPAHLAETPLDVLVAGALDRSGVHPRLLEVEITETALVADVDATAAAVRAVRELGVTVTLDDFGTGHAGLGYLTSIPLDRVKLDRSFVATIRPGAPVSRVVEAVLAVADSLDLELVAEGVETEHQAAWLRERGCDTFQGFLFGRPAPAEDVPTWVPSGVDPYRINQTLLAVCRNTALDDPSAIDEVLALLDAPGVGHEVVVAAGSHGGVPPGPGHGWSRHEARRPHRERTWSR